MEKRSKQWRAEIRNRTPFQVKQVLTVAVETGEEVASLRNCLSLYQETMTVVACLSAQKARTNIAKIM